MAINKVLKVDSNSELLSFIINSNPILSSEIDLPLQGESIKPIGRLIISNDRYKNAFLNTINLIGLTVIDRNYWQNPWEKFANRGTLKFGQSVRELICDIADVFDYNEFANDPTHFLENVVPNVYNYIHELNLQKFYKTTTSDEQIAMAFTNETGLFDLIEKIITSLYEAYKYDKYIVDKYQLCRRILDGTMTSVYIENYDNLSSRERVSKLKDVSNKMTFRSPNYNPSGIRIATNFDNQIAIINTDFEASLSTEVLATSFFRNDAEMKSRSALIDGFDNHDEERLQEVLGKQYIPFTDEEKSSLKNVIATIIDDEFFQDYVYSLDNQAEQSTSGTRATNFFNPETLKNNHWLHAWLVISTSPFKNAVVISKAEPTITSVEISPAESTVSAGIPVQLTAVVNTTGFANKSVVWAVDEAPGQKEGSPVTVDINGLVTIPKNYTSTNTESPNPIVISATSVFDKTKKNTATITVL